MKKIGIGVGVFVVILVLCWAGATFAIGNYTEPVFDQLVEDANETTNVKWSFMRIEKTNFDRGFTSSTAKSAVFPSGKDVSEDEKLFLKHTIYHGPLAMTPNGPKVCQVYIVSVVDWSNLGKESLQEMREVFGDAEPLTIRTTRKIGGSEEYELEVAPAKFSDDDVDGTFGGILGMVKVDSERTKISGNFEVAQSEIKFSEKEGILKMEPSKADFSYSKGVDLKADLRLGDFEILSTTGDNFMINASGLIFTADFSPIDEESLIMVGKAELHSPGVELKTKDSVISLTDFRVGVESGVEAEKLFGQVKYGFGGAKVAGPEFPGMEELGSVLEKGASIGFGVRGIDRQVVENFYKILGEAEAKSNGKDLDLESLAPEIAAAFSNDVFNFFQPGLEIFHEVLIGEKHKGIEANLSLRMKGNKRLDELKTGREIVNAIEGVLTAEMAKSFPPDDSTQTMMELYAQQGLIQTKTDPAGYTFKGELMNGVLHLGGEATPLLNSFGPMLDEPIPWDEFKKGFNSGVEDAAKNANKKSTSDSDTESENDDSEEDKSEKPE